MGLATGVGVPTGGGGPPLKGPKTRWSAGMGQAVGHLLAQVEVVAGRDPVIAHGGAVLERNIAYADLPVEMGAGVGLAGTEGVAVIALPAY